MKKTWNTPELEELSLQATANGMVTDENFDGDWVSINGRYYKPGLSELLCS